MKHKSLSQPTLDAFETGERQAPLHTKRDLDYVLIAGLNRIDDAAAAVGRVIRRTGEWVGLSGSIPVNEEHERVMNVKAGKRTLGVAAIITASSVIASCGIGTNDRKECETFPMSQFGDTPAEAATTLDSIYPRNSDIYDSALRDFSETGRIQVCESDEIRMLEQPS